MFVGFKNRSPAFQTASPSGETQIRKAQRTSGRRRGHAYHAESRKTLVQQQQKTKLKLQPIKNPMAILYQQKGIAIK
jgi:hypothetical protein